METETAQSDEVTVEEQEALLLDFSEATERRKRVAPNGEPYEIRNLDEFGLLEEDELRVNQKRFRELQELEKPKSVAQQKEYVALLKDIFEQVVVASPETLESFNDRQKQRVLLVFTAAQLGEEAQLTKAAMALISRGNDSTTES